MKSLNFLSSYCTVCVCNLFFFFKTENSVCVYIVCLLLVIVICISYGIAEDMRDKVIQSAAMESNYDKFHLINKSCY